MNVTSKIAVDLTRANIGARVNAVQGDGSTRSVDITLLADGNPWTPPGGVEAAIAYKHPGGTKGLYNLLADGTPAISISGNVATVILATQMLAVPGTVYASIVFNNAQLDQLTTFPFTVSVAQNQYAGAQKTEDYIRLQWLEAKLDEYLKKFEGGVDEATVQRIVNEYLAANPPTVTETDPTVPAWAKEPQKPTYTADEVGALSAETLPGAINTALAQAKDSGAFDGAPGEDGNPGAPGADGYSPTASVTQTDTGAVITITDKAGTTTATLKNGADGQPGTTGATPNIQIGTVDTLDAGSPATASMTGTPENPILNLGIPQGPAGSGEGGSGIAVTGATVGQTVKIAAVDDNGVPTAWESVDFPSGGAGSGDDWEEIDTITLKEDTASVIISQDKNGNPFSLKKLFVIFNPAYNADKETSSRIRLCYRTSIDHRICDIFLSATRTISAVVYMDEVQIIASTHYDAATGYFDTYAIKTHQLTRNDMGDPITELAMRYVTYYAGSKITVWGVRA